MRTNSGAPELLPIVVGTSSPPTLTTLTATLQARHRRQSTTRSNSQASTRTKGPVLFTSEVGSTTPRQLPSCREIPRESFKPTPTLPTHHLMRLIQGEPTPATP